MIRCKRGCEITGSLLTGRVRPLSRIVGLLNSFFPSNVFSSLYLCTSDKMTSFDSPQWRNNGHVHDPVPYKEVGCQNECFRGAKAAERAA